MIVGKYVLPHYHYLQRKQTYKHLIYENVCDYSNSKLEDKQCAQKTMTPKRNKTEIKVLTNPGLAETDRHMDRQTDNQTHGQTSRQTDKQTGRLTDRQADRQTD